MPPKLVIVKALDQPIILVSASDINQDSEISSVKTMSCSNKSHDNYSGGKYPKDKVPIEKFLGNKKYSKKLLRQCEDCRLHRNKILQDKKEKLLKLKDVNKDPDFGICVNRMHELEGVSTYPRNKVPKQMFLINPEDPNGKVSDNCSDCRNFSNKGKIERKKKAKEEASKNNQFYCNSCNVPKNIEERAKNKDGTPSSLCIPCQEYKINYTKETYDEMKLLREKLMKELIIEHEFSCEMCQSIFLIPEEENQCFFEIPTRIENGVRILDYKGETYVAKDFLIKFQDKLDLAIMDFDHLPENEQRERGLIKDGEAPFVKGKYISSNNNEFTLRKEMIKCQIIDCLCHLKVTIAREKGAHPVEKNSAIKRDYVNKIKEKGCSICGFFQPGMHRFIDMDHMIPANKVANVAEMVLYQKYSLEDTINECEKCRPICKFGHRRHTQWQRDEGIVENVKRGFEGENNITMNDISKIESNNNALDEMIENDSSNNNASDMFTEDFL